MPGVVSAFDTYVKGLIQSHFEIYRELPLWLKNKFDFSVQEVLKVEKLVRRFPIRNTNQILILSGIPDAIWRLKDGSLCIVDLKLARFNERQKKLLPMYELQLNLYALLSEIKYKKVSNLFLLYFQPRFQKISAKEFNIVNKNNFSLLFDLLVIPIKKLDEHKVKETIYVAYTYLNRSTPPHGKQGCQGCKEVLKWSMNLGSKIFSFKKTR